MKRFFVLGGEMYYAKGGMHDFLSDHDEIGEALKATQIHRTESYNQPLEWWQIVDMEKRIVVLSSREGAYGAPDNAADQTRPFKNTFFCDNITILDQSGN